MDVDETRRALLVRAARIANSHQDLRTCLGDVGAIFRIPKDPKIWGLDFPDPMMIPAAVEARGQKMEDVLPTLTRIVNESIRQAIRENPDAIGSIILETMRTDQDPWNAYTS